MAFVYMFIVPPDMYKTANVPQSHISTVPNFLPTYKHISTENFGCPNCDVPVRCPTFLSSTRRKPSLRWMREMTAEFIISNMPEFSIQCDFEREGISGTENHFKGPLPQYRENERHLCPGTLSFLLYKRNTPHPIVLIATISIHNLKRFGVGGRERPFVGK